MSQHGAGKSIHREINYLISQKTADSRLTVFDGSIKDFEEWKDLMISHMSLSTSNYELLIQNAGKAPAQIKKNDLISTEVDGFNAWEISREVEKFTVRFMSNSLRKDKLQLCSIEEGNGLEMWRNLFKKYSGKGNKVVEVSGLQLFMRFPRAESEHNLLKHMADWEQDLLEYGGNLKHDASTLRALFLGILPEHLESKYTPKFSQYPTWESLHVKMKEKLELPRSVQISNAVHDKRRPAASPGRRVHSIIEDGTQRTIDPGLGASAPAPTSKPVPVPTMADIAAMINAVSQNNGTRKPNGRAGPPARRSEPARVRLDCFINSD